MIEKPRQHFSHTMDGKVFDEAVNKVITLLQDELKLKPVEMVLVTKVAFEHLSKVFDIRVEKHDAESEPYVDPKDIC